MKKGFLIFLLFLLLIAAGFFFWQKKQTTEIDINNQQPAGNSQNQEALKNTGVKTTEEITTSTPFIAPKGEIARGNPNKKQLIFTFDCGAGTNSANKILEIAQKHGIKLTFFTTGKFTEKNPEIIKKFAAAGHEVFNHTYDHPYLTKITDEQIKDELAKADGIISQQTDATTKPYFRPPYGDRNQHVLEIASELGYQSVYWTTDALDWMPDKTRDQVKTQIYSHLKNGAIFLMHVGDDITGQILDEVFTKVENDGYKIVSLTEGLK